MANFIVMLYPHRIKTRPQVPYIQCYLVVAGYALGGNIHHIIMKHVEHCCCNASRLFQVYIK